MYNDPDTWIQPDQEAVEFSALLEIYKELKPGVVLEIGVREGGTFYQWMKHAKPRTVIVGVDLPCGRWGENITADYARFWKYAGQKSVTISMILGDSHHPITRNAVVGMIDKADFAFIDGDHTYDAVVADFQFCKSLIAPGGIIAIHDILPNNRDKDIEVPRFWEELKKRYTYKELISQDNQNGYGIGLVYL